MKYIIHIELMIDHEVYCIRKIESNHAMTVYSTFKVEQHHATMDHVVFYKYN